MSEDQNFTVAVIGCGHWGKNLVRNFNEMGMLSAISDPDPNARKLMLENFGVKAQETEEILNNDNIDAVVIAAPAEAHYEIALQALNANKHVFVEKPITLTMNHAKRLYDIANARGKTLMVGHILQYHPAFLKLKQMIREGELGKLRYIYSRRLSIGKIRTRESVLWCFAPHDVSMVLALTGNEPEKTTGFGGSFLRPHISDFASLNMEFPDNIKAHIEVSWLNPFKEQRLVVIGETGMMVFDDQADKDKLLLYRHRAEIINGKPALAKADPVSIEFDEIEPLRNECEHFIHFCQSGETPFTDGREAMAVLKILQDGDKNNN